MWHPFSEGFTANSFVLVWNNPFWTRYPFLVIRQTVQTQFRRCRTRRLIRVNIVCLQEFLCKSNKNKKNPPQIPKTRNGLIQIIRMDMSAGQKSGVGTYSLHMHIVGEDLDLVFAA